ncbi:hypothetical protein D5086_016325 [Populus alba]|uniref:Uncharacterized protein n=1 Tax=Populus alba TaxID=43335 RepID=A0ACC4BTN2_POPAL
MSSSLAKAGSSGSDVDAPNAMIDEKRRKRMISNRESARRSRMKRQKHLEGLNKILRDEKMKLAENLKNLQQILSGYEVPESDQDIEVSDRFLNPWQVSSPVKPITASVMFTF